MSRWPQNVGVSMIGDLQRLQDISQELSVTITHSNVLPEKTVEFITEMCPLATKGQSNDFQGIYICYFMYVLVQHLFSFC